MRFRLTDIRDRSVQEVDLSLKPRDMAGWQSGVVGWSIGPKGSGAPLELDQPLHECHVGIFTFSLGALIWGVAKNLPEVWLLLPQHTRTLGALVPFEPERWLLIEREEMSRVAMGGDVRLRVDQTPVRFGSYILETLRITEIAKERCSFCDEPLQTYFRVGNQQVCPACTEKFKQERRANLARYYRRALGVGVVVALAGGVTAGRLSLGSILIGVLVGMAMRIASHESAGTRHRLTAVILTFAAGALPWWWQRSNSIALAAVYLVIGMLAAWVLAARNVRTEIHGPFQSKAA